MPDAIVILDMRDRIIDLNQAAIKYLGKPRELVLGYSLQRLVPSEVPRLRAYQHIWDTKEQIQLGSPDAPIFFTMSITPLYDWRKRLRGRMCIFRDTSELQKRELALQEAKADLEMLNQRLVELMTSREIAQNQVLEQQRQLAIMNEREQLARDLHDNLGQVLGFFNMQAQASRKYMRDLDLNAIDAQLALIAEVALDSQLQLRDTIRELKSPVQTERRFFPSLALQIAKFEHDYGIHVIQEIDPRVSRRGFDATVSYQLLNIVQEALNNIAKHAQASAVRLDILPSSSAADQAMIIITDNGAGFLVTPPASALGHLGLGFMQERAQLAGGEIHIQSQPGQGTQLTIEMPLRELIQGETA
jgi:signal transduction histidine kinase